MTTTTTCGHDFAAFGTTYRLDPLSLAVLAAGLFGSCLDHYCEATVEFSIDSRGTTGTASLT